MEKLKNIITKILVFINILLLIVIILLLPLRYYLYNFKFYNLLYEKNNVYKLLDKDDVKKITNDVFNFFRTNKPFEVFNLKSGHAYFTKKEISHLDDVRILLKKILTIFYSSCVLFFIFLLILLVLYRKKYILYLKKICLIFISSSIFMIFFIVFLYFLGNNFSDTFEKFHFLFFPQGNWTFDQTALIITIFPFGFFYDFFFKLVVSSFIISVIFLIIPIICLIFVNKFEKIKKLEMIKNNSKGKK